MVDNPTPQRDLSELAAIVADTNKKVKQDLINGLADKEKLTVAEIRLVAEKNKQIPGELFEYIVDARAKHLVPMMERIAKVRESSINKDGEVIPPRSDKDKEEEIARKKFDIDVREDVATMYFQKHLQAANNPKLRETFNKQVDEALEAVKSPDTVSKVTNAVSDGFSTATKFFFDKDKGGLQTGGLLGLVAGLIGGSFLTGGASAGFMGILSTLAVTVGAVWLGNKFIDSKDKDTVVVNAGATPSVKAEADKQQSGPGLKEYAALEKERVAKANALAGKQENNFSLLAGKTDLKGDPSPGSIPLVVANSNTPSIQ